MADDDKNDAQEPLSEEQRITNLEKKVGTSKILLFAIALFLIIIISVSITAVTLYVVKGSKSGSQEDIIALQEQMTSMQADLEDMDSRLAELSLMIPELKGRIVNSSNAVIQQVLIDQEKSHQAFLDTLRSATYDLAHMVPGSRSWLELYGTQIDSTIEGSKARMKKLEQLKTGDPVVDDEAFFGDGF